MSIDTVVVQCLLVHLTQVTFWIAPTSPKFQRKLLRLPPLSVRYESPPFLLLRRCIAVFIPLLDEKGLVPFGGKTTDYPELVECFCAIDRLVIVSSKLYEILIRCFFGSDPIGFM